MPFETFPSNDCCLFQYCSIHHRLVLCTYLTDELQKDVIVAIEHTNTKSETAPKSGWQNNIFGKLGLDLFAQYSFYLLSKDSLRQGNSNQAQRAATSKSNIEFNGKIKTRASKPVYIIKREMNFCEATCTL